MHSAQDISTVIQIIRLIKNIKINATQIVPGMSNDALASQILSFAFSQLSTLIPVQQLNSLLVQQGLQAPSNPTVSQLQTYVSSKANSIMNAGINVNSIPVGTTTAGIALLTGAHDFVTANPNATVNFVVSPNQTVVLSAAQVTAMWSAVTQFIQAVFTAEATAYAEINAQPPTVTTTTQVDSVFSSVNRSY